MSPVRETLVSLAVVAGIAAGAQQPSTFRTGVDIVTVTATVTGRDGRFVSGLGQDDFTIFEDGQHRDVLYFADESAPISLGILLDASGSMAGGKLGLARETISRLDGAHRRRAAPPRPAQLFDVRCQRWTASLAPRGRWRPRAKRPCASRIRG